FLEIVYADAVEYELQKRNIPYEREKKFQVHYKDTAGSRNIPSRTPSSWGIWPLSWALRWKAGT
ncbi:MAG: GxxExxY protein, partial [Candidatus Desulfacyla sp.]